MSTVVETTESAILARVVNEQGDDLSLDLARAVLRMEFTLADRAEMHRLTQINQAGQLDEHQRQALDAYRRVGYFLDLMKSKARRSLRSTASN